MKINTNLVNEIIKAWANNYVEDVPAVHKGGQYLIEYDTLVDHLNNLTHEQLTNIMLEVEGNHLGD